MNNRSKINNPLILGLLLLLPLLGLLLSPLQAEAADLRLLYNNDNMGELDGCG